LESADTTMSEKAKTTLSKTTILISKWTDGEADLMRLLQTTKPDRLNNMEKKLDELYFQSLKLVCTVYESGKTKGSRAGMFAVACIYIPMDSC